MRTILIALITGVAGALLALLGGDLATRAHRVSDFEGGRGMLLVFVIVPAGFLVAGGLGFLVARKMADPGLAGFARAQGVALLGAALLAAAVFGLAYLKAPRAPSLDGQYLNLEFEVRMPEGRVAPDSTDGFTVLMTSRGSGDDRRNADLKVDSIYTSDGRVVIPAAAFLRTTTTQRSLVVNDLEGKYYWFDLPLRARPRAEDEQWTDWWPAPGQSATADINGNGGFQIRYRVQRIPTEGANQ